MKIQYLPHFEFSEESDLCRVLRHLPGTVDVRPGAIFPKFRYRWQLYFDSWRRLVGYAWVAMRRAPRDTSVVVAWTHLALLPYLLARLVRFRPKLVLVGFIYTDRTSRLLRILRWAYFRMLLGKVDLVVTHASAEAVGYSHKFGQPSDKFVFVPLSLHMAAVATPDLAACLYVASAGRSNRDYDTLLAAAEQLLVPVRIVCDSFQSSRSVPPNVEILRNCHQGDYLSVLAGARLVVIPLKEDDVSSGQMVLLHSMALGKPVVLTDCRGIRDYFSPGLTGLTIERGSVESCVTAIRRLLSDDELAAQLGESARARYQAHHTLRAGLEAVATLIERRFA